MIKLKAGDKLLLWSGSAGTAGTLANLFQDSPFRWAVFSEIADLDGLDPTDWECLILMGEAPRAERVIQRVRRTPGWLRTPVVFFGGPEPEGPQTDPNLFCVPAPQDRKDLEKLFGFPFAKDENGDSPGKPFTFRSTYRHFCDKPGWVEMKVQVIDVSECGAQLETDFPVPAGTEFKLNLGTLNPELEPHALPFRVLAYRPCLPPKKSFRLHGRFFALTPEQEKIIRRTMIKVQVDAARLNPTPVQKETP